MKIQKDKYLHFLACAIIAFFTSLVSFILNSKGIEIIYSGFMAGIAIGLGKEYGDFTCSNNKWDNYDIIADILGAAIGSVLVFVLYLITK